MPDLPAFHGWTHRPKAQGGTDPIVIPPSSASFLYSLGVQDITTIDDWVSAEWNSWTLNRDELTDDVAVLLDGDPADNAVGTEFTFAETSDAHDSYWLLGASLAWRWVNVTCSTGTAGDQHNAALQIINDPAVVSLPYRHIDSCRVTLNGSLSPRVGGVIDADFVRVADLFTHTEANNARANFVTPAPLLVQVLSEVPYDGVAPPQVSSGWFWGVRYDRI